MEPGTTDPGTPHIEVSGLTMAYGSFVVMKDVTFDVRKGDITIVMGVSGCGKSTLMKHMIGLLEPEAGVVRYDGTTMTGADADTRSALMRRFGVLYQGGALWSSMTLAENLALPIEEFTDLSRDEVRSLVSLKLALVGLRGFESFYPAELSGGMRKRAALARALALDPDILFFDEPSAGLDPISARRLDDLILQIRDSLGTTIIVVTHELESIFAIGDDAIYLDIETRTVSARGNPKALRDDPPNENVHLFLTRGRQHTEPQRT